MNKNGIGKIVGGLVVTLLAFSFSNGRGLEFVGKVSGRVLGDRFGSVIAPIGDINGDGYADFAVGAMGSYRSANYAGYVYVFMGGQKFNPSPRIVLHGENAGDRFGVSIAGIGDINKDGYDDFAVGADRNDESATDAGKVYIFLGGANMDTIPFKTIKGEKANDWFGLSITGGKDINNDGEPDFLVSAGYGGKKSSGALYIYLSGEINKPALTIEGESGGDMFGSAISIVGDITGDKINDFIVGAYYSSPDGKNTAGKAYIFKGGPVIAPVPHEVLKGEVEKGWFGFAIGSIYDITGDTIPDFAISAPRANEGRVYIYSGKDFARPFLTLKGAFQKDLFGYSISSCGDQNGDGINDIIIGSPYNSENGYHSGKAEVFFTGKGLDNLSDTRVLGGAENAENGYAINLIPGFFGKGKNLIVVGAPNSETNKPGEIQLYK